MPTAVYPFDETGVATTNLVENENHFLTEINADTYRILIPAFSPFYLHNLLVESVDDAGVAVPLIEGSGFYPCLPYLTASRSLGKAVYGGISIMDTIVEGTIRLRYQTLGGPWCADPDYVYSRLLEDVYNDRTTWWEKLTNVQEIFPPTIHAVPAATIDGMTDLLAKLEEIRAAILSGDQSLPAEYLAHLLMRGNPHETTLQDLGLENIANYPPASDQEVMEMMPVDKFPTVRQIVNLLRSLNLVP